MFNVHYGTIMAINLTITTTHQHRMVGWLKGFVHSRQHGPASLMKGYSIHMLVRRAPTQIAFEYNKRFADQGIDMTNRGHLILVPDLVAQRANRPGCGVVHVIKRNSTFKKTRYSRLSTAFLLRFNAYNNAVKRSARYTLPDSPDTDVSFYRVEDGNALLMSTHTPCTTPSTYCFFYSGSPGVTINGYDIRSNHHLGVRAFYKNKIIYADITHIIYVFEHTTKFNIFIEVSIRPLIRDDVLCPIVGPPGPPGDRVYLEPLTDTTHLVRFIDVSTTNLVVQGSPLNTCMCMKIYATTPKWQYK
jgi:hypothetical protein